MVNKDYFLKMAAPLTGAGGQQRTRVVGRFVRPQVPGVGPTDVLLEHGAAERVTAPTRHRARQRDVTTA